ncbi:unnamed protein product, partial [Cylicostephanus goldi]
CSSSVRLPPWFQPFYNDTFDNQLYVYDAVAKFDAATSQTKYGKSGTHTTATSTSIMDGFGNVTDLMMESTTFYRSQRDEESQTLPVPLCTLQKVNKTAILVRADVFLEDLVILRHTCMAIERIKDKAARLFYEVVHASVRNPEATLQPTINHWLTIFDKIGTMTWGDAEKRNAVMPRYTRKMILKADDTLTIGEGTMSAHLQVADHYRVVCMHRVWRRAL